MVHQFNSPRSLAEEWEHKKDFPQKFYGVKIVKGWGGNCTTEKRLSIAIKLASL